MSHASDLRGLIDQWAVLPRGAARARAEREIAGYGGDSLGALIDLWISGGAGDTTTLANALAIVAYFFDRCHIFESPAGGMP